MNRKSSIRRLRTGLPANVGVLSSAIGPASQRAGLASLLGLAQMVALAFILLPETKAQADDTPGQKRNDPPNTPAATPASAFFNSDRVDFWNSKNKPSLTPTGKGTQPDLAGPQAGAVRNFWLDSTYKEDGTVTSYTPPKILVDLLENPTDENARRYLAWQKERLDKILKAQQAIDRTKNKVLGRLQAGPPNSFKQPHPPGESDPGGTSPALLPKPSLPQDPQDRADGLFAPSPFDSAARQAASAIRWDQLDLIYFFIPDCSHCVKQHEELKKLKHAFPDVRIASIDVSANPDLAQVVGLKGTPTILLKKKSDARILRLEGTTPAATLLTNIKALFDDKTEEKTK